MDETPFDSLEAAHDYVSLLLEEVRRTRQDVAEDLAAAQGNGSARRGEALQLVSWKLERLEQQLGSSRRLMNDLRRLRRLLVGDLEDAAERTAPAAEAAAPSDALDDPWDGE
jgi:hypothetical protein